MVIIERVEPYDQRHFEHDKRTTGRRGLCSWEGETKPREPDRPAGKRE